MEIMDLVLDELNSRMTYKSEIYAPFYVCSAMTHSFNLMNERREIYWDGKRLPNMRLHLLFVAPPGFMKSYYMDTMGGGRYGIFRNCGIQIGSEQSMTEAGFIGTIVNVNGVNTPSEGAALTYSKGILLIDEFSAITNALKSQYNSQLDAQLLAALDSGNVFKRLGGGKIEYTTRLSLWAGVQPAKYDLTSGLGRRMCFMVFLPTRYDNDALLETMHKTRNIRPNDHEMESLWKSINNVLFKMDIIENIIYDDSVFNTYKELGLFSYETSYFDRLLLGWHLATYGPDKDMVIHTKDKALQEIVHREKVWRDSISKGVDYVQLERIIKAAGIEMDGKIQIMKKDLINEAIMVGWSADQVFEMLGSMIKFGMVEVKGHMIAMDM